jgi:pre-mRNA-processing factor 19
MSLITCNLSNQVLKNPVVDRKTGHVYEKDIIIKHIETTGQCPVTGKELFVEDLIEINKNPIDLVISDKALKSSSMPSILSKINTEYETLAFDNFSMKKQLQEVNSELSHVMYQHEAANLVICRLIKERDEARQHLNKLKAKLSELEEENKGEEREDEEFDFMGIHQELISRINKLSSLLSSERKGKKIPTELKSIEELKEYRCKNSFPIHSSSKPGILCLDIHPQNNNLILTGGMDSRAVLFDLNKENVIYSVEKAHSKRINHVEFYPVGDILAFLLCSQDNFGSFHIQDYENTRENISSHNLYKFQERYRVRCHKASLTCSSFHPLREYALISSRDKCWSVHNLFKGVCLTRQKTETDAEITKCDFHPDGIFKI